ncbi:hypothetical protein ACFOGJ_28405 [Marinibaculum pumilum]|uniref:Transporter n=1 Tax=Marinibaculum pumilum TaxID=1766165 RepID=A0ABV7L9C4_9PROT
MLGAAPSAAEVFEVIHPEIRKDGFELESLNAVVLSEVARGDERSVHELALSYAPLSFWKPTVALEIANPESESAEVEAYEFESLFLLPLGGAGAGHDHDHGHDHGHDGAASYALGLYTALGIPNTGGIGKAVATVGPVGEVTWGPVATIGNLFVDLPFEDGVDAGLSYALSVSTGIGGGIDAGVEAFGAVDEAFGNAPPLDQQEHFVGPALYGDFDLGRGRILEPRVALLLGWTDAAPDAVLSFNIELKF